MKLNLLFILIVLVFTISQAKKQKKWRPPLEFGPKTTSIYSSLQRSNRRKINVDLVDPYDDRTKPPRARLSGTSYKPGTWNWYPNMDIPGYSYRFRVFNITKDQAGSYVGMQDYRKNYGPLDNTRFGGTYAPIPPLLGDPRQPRLAWYLKKYAPPTPPSSYIDHIMDTIKDGQIRDKEYEKQLEPENKRRVSAEWYTVRPKNESNYFYEEVKIKPRFGDYGGIPFEGAFPAYKPKEPYEVVMVPERQNIYKRSAESLTSDEKKSRGKKSTEINSKDKHSKENNSKAEKLKKLIAEKKKKYAESSSYSSNSYAYEQFDSNESISGPFTAEQQFSSDSSSSPEKNSMPAKKGKTARRKRSDEESSGSSVHEPWSKSESFPAPLNTGESGWGAKPPPGYKSTESGSDRTLPPDYFDVSGSLGKSEKSIKPKKGKEKKDKIDKKKKGEKGNPAPQSGYPDEPFPRMKIENDSEKPRDSSGLENESFPSPVNSDHSSSMVIWDAMRNFSAEFQPIVSSSELESSGDLSKFGSESESSVEKKDPKDKKDTKNDRKKDTKKDIKKDAKKDTKPETKKGANKDVKMESKIAKSNLLKKNSKGAKLTELQSNPTDKKADKLKFSNTVKNTEKPKTADKKSDGSDEYSEDGMSNPYGDLSYVEEVSVDPPHLRTFPPTFTEPYVAPLHHQPDEFWDEIYRPDGPDPTFAPYQIEEEKQRKADKKQREERKKRIKEEEERKKEEEKRIKKERNKITTTWKPPIITTRDPTAKPRFIYVTNEESDSDESKILVSSESKSYATRSGDRSKSLSLQAHHSLGLSKTQKQLRRILKLKNKAKALHEAKTKNINDIKNAGISVKGKDKGRKEKKKPKKKDKEKKYNPNNFSRPNPDHLKVQGKSEAHAIGDPIGNNQKRKIEEPGFYINNDPFKIYAAVTPFEPDYSFSESRPSGNYEWPSVRHPKFDPETAYDEEGYPVHESPDWTSPTTHKKDRIFGRERERVASGVRGRGIVMPQFLKRMRGNKNTNKAQEPAPLNNKAVFMDTNPHNNKVSEPAKPLSNKVANMDSNTHNKKVSEPAKPLSSKVANNIKIQLQQPPIEEKTMDSKVSSKNIVNLPHLNNRPSVLQVRQKRNADETPPYTMNPSSYGFLQHPPTNTVNPISSEHLLKPIDKTLTPTSRQLHRGLSITRNPFMTDEYKGNYNEKWGFTKKMNHRMRPSWWTRPPFHVTRGMFDPPPGYVHPPGPTKLFWPGLRVYRRLGPELPPSTYPPIWFRTGKTNFPHTLSTEPQNRTQELKTEVTHVPTYQHIDSFELDTDPVPTIRIRTGRTNFPHIVHPFIKKALWGKVKPEDREAFTYPPKWLFNDIDDDFPVSEEFTESNIPSKANEATAWMSPSFFPETSLERPEKMQSTEESVYKRRPTFPPVWFRTGRTNFPHKVSTFVKAAWGKVKPENRDKFTNTPIWMMDYDNFLLADIPTESLLARQSPTHHQTVSTLNTSPWLTNLTYWSKLYPQVNASLTVNGQEPLFEEGPAQWTRPPGVAGLGEPEVTEAITTTRRSFVFDILEKRRKNKIKEQASGITSRPVRIEETPINFNHPKFFNNNENDYPPHNNEYYRPEPRTYSQYPEPRYNNEYPRHIGNRPRYDNRKSAFAPRYGRGNTRFSRQNRRPNSQNYYTRDGPRKYSRERHNTFNSFTNKTRLRYRSKRSATVLNYQLIQLLGFNKNIRLQNIGKYAISKSVSDQLNNKIQSVKFRPETLWENLGKERLLINKSEDRDNFFTIKCGTERNDVNHNLNGISNKLITKCFINSNEFYNKKKKKNVPDFDHYHKIDQILQEESSGTPSLIRSFESSEEKYKDESSEEMISKSTPRSKFIKPTKFKWVDRKWEGFLSDKSESDSSLLTEYTTQLPKRKNINPKVQMRRDLRTKEPKVIRVPFNQTVFRTTPTEIKQRRKRNLYDEINYGTTERDLHFEAWLKAKREEEERERLLFGLGLTTPDYLNEPLRSSKSVRRRASRTKVIWVAKTKRPKVYVVPFTLPERLRKKAVTLKGRMEQGGRKKKGVTSKTLPSITITLPTDPPGYFKFGKRIYWLTPRTTYKPTWLRPRRLKPLTTATTTELPSPKFATLINIYRTTEKPTMEIRRRRTHKARTFRTLRKLILTTKATTSSESDNLESDDIEDVEFEVADSNDSSDDENVRVQRTFPTLKLKKIKKQEVISFREYLQRRENLMREKEESMWNAQFAPESEEEITTPIPEIPVVLTLPPVIPTLPPVTYKMQTSQQNLSTHKVDSSTKPMLQNLKLSKQPNKTDQTTQITTKVPVSVKNTRRTYKPRSTSGSRRTRGTRAKRGRVRRIPEHVNIFPTVPFSDIGRTKRELLTPENELLEVTTEGNNKTLDSVFEMLNKQNMELQEAFFKKYEVPLVETTTFEYNIDNLCNVYNAEYGKTSRDSYLETLYKSKNISTLTQGSNLNNDYSSLETNDTNSNYNIVKRSINSDGRIILNTRMRSVSKNTRRIPVEVQFNSSEYTDQALPNFDLYNARRSTWFNTTLKSRPVHDVTYSYVHNQFRHNNWRFKPFHMNSSTYTPNFRQYFKNKRLWFNKTNDIHYKSKVETSRSHTEKQQRWFVRNPQQTNRRRETFIDNKDQNGKLKKEHYIPNFSVQDLIKQRHRWGDKDYIPKIDRHVAQKVLHQHENPDQSIEDRENDLIRRLHLDKVIPVHMSLLQQVSDPDLMDQDDYMDVKRYQPPPDFLKEQFNYNQTYNPEFRLNTHRDIKINKRKRNPKEAENRRLNFLQYKKELYEANGDYRKYPNLDALKQRRALSLFTETVEDDSIMKDFIMTEQPTTVTERTDRADDMAFEKFLKEQMSLSTEATKLKMKDQYNRTYIHDLKLNKTYYPQLRRHVIDFNENETDLQAYDKYIRERHNYYNLSMDIIFTHYVFSTMKHENITCTYGRMSNVINRWYNKTFYPHYRPDIYSKKYNIAIDKNYAKLLKKLEDIKETYQHKIKLMTAIDSENITSRLEKEEVVKDEYVTRDVSKPIQVGTEEAVDKMTEATLAVHEESVIKDEDRVGSGVKLATVTDLVGEEEKPKIVADAIETGLDASLSAETMTKMLIKQKEIRQKQYEEEMKRTTTESTITTTTETTTEHFIVITSKTTPGIKYHKELKTTETVVPEKLKSEEITIEKIAVATDKIVTQEETTTEKVETSRTTHYPDKRVTTLRTTQYYPDVKITTLRTTQYYPDFKLTMPPTKPTKKPKVSFFKKLLSKIEPIKIIKSWFSWGKKKKETPE